jgi:hypothetical protein
VKGLARSVAKWALIVALLAIGLLVVEALIYGPRPKDGATSIIKTISE